MGNLVQVELHVTWFLEVAQHQLVLMINQCSDRKYQVGDVPNVANVNCWRHEKGLLLLPYSTFFWIYLSTTCLFNDADHLLFFC